MFNGFGNIKLPEIDDAPKLLEVGDHIVTITEAKVAADAARGTHQLELSYENDNGKIRNWLYINHPTSEKATENGLRQIKRLLIALGHEGDVTPEDVAYFRGKKVGINVYDDMYTGTAKRRVKYHFNPAEKASTQTDTKLNDDIPF